MDQEKSLYEKCFQKGKPKEKQRTLTQNRAMHEYFNLVAEALNDAGLDIRAVLKPDVEIEWDAHTVKEYLWKGIQKVQLKKDSTTQLNTQEITLVYETMNRHLAKHGVHVPFPTMDELCRQMGDQIEKSDA